MSQSTARNPGPVKADSALRQVGEICRSAPQPVEPAQNLEFFVSTFSFKLLPAISICSPGKHHLNTRVEAIHPIQPIPTQSTQSIQSNPNQTSTNWQNSGRAKYFDLVVSLFQIAWGVLVNNLNWELDFSEKNIWVFDVKRCKQSNPPKPRQGHFGLQF